MGQENDNDLFAITDVHNTDEYDLFIDFDATKDAIDLSELFKDINDDNDIMNYIKITDSGEVKVNKSGSGDDKAYDTVAIIGTPINQQSINVILGNDELYQVQLSQDG